MLNQDQITTNPTSLLIEYDLDKLKIMPVEALLLQLVCRSDRMFPNYKMEIDFFETKQKMEEYFAKVIKDAKEEGFPVQAAQLEKIMLGGI